MASKPLILKHKKDAGHNEDGLAEDGGNDPDNWDDELKEEEKKEDGLGGSDDTDATDDEDGNY